MINILKFKEKEDQKIYFFSDLHYCHDRSFILEKRGFDNIQDHNRVLIERWNNKITDNDIVFLLGDTVVGAGNESLETFQFLLKTLNYKELYVMPGNHYAGYRQIFDTNLDYQIDKYYRLTFRAKHRDNDYNFGLVHFIPNYYEVFVNSQLINLCHYPVLSWNSAGKGSWLIYGHCHNSLEQTDWIKQNYLIGKCLDVGVESISEPISFDEIKKIMDDKQIIKVDHH